MNDIVYLQSTKNKILDRFQSISQSDPRILAATLHGSHARGAADAWSDLDLGVVVTDDAYEDFIASREAFIRQLGEPLFNEDFDIPGLLFFILADGTEGEITIDRASDFTEPYGPWRPLVDKDDTLARAKPRPQPDPAAQAESLRRQVMWFFHDLSHFITAMGRGQLWWAAGQLEILRRTCVILARLAHDFADASAAEDPYFKIDEALPAGVLAPLAATIVPLERTAMLAAARMLVDYYRPVAHDLAGKHGIRYPAELEDVMLRRMERLPPAGDTL